MTRYSFVLTTTLLFCALVVVTEGRSVENELLLPEEFELDTKFDENDDDEEARHMPDIGSGFGDSSSMIDSINRYIDEKIQMLNSLRPQGGSSSESDQASVIFIPSGCGSSCDGGGVGGGVGGGNGGDMVGGSGIQGDAFIGALVPELVAAAINEENAGADADAEQRRRRRRRRRPVYISSNRRVSQNRRRAPSSRRVFVIHPSDIQ